MMNGGPINGSISIPQIAVLVHFNTTPRITPVVQDISSGNSTVSTKFPGAVLLASNNIASLPEMRLN
jgi:hypothetical protein